MPLPQHSRLDAPAESSRPHLRRLRGSFRQPLFSPSGRLEGLLLEVGQRTAQIVLESGHVPPPLSRIEVGQFLSLEAVEVADEPGERRHPIYAFRALIAIDGKPAQTAPAVLRGRVTGINYARDGQADGVMLDSGDFVHLGTDGFRLAELAPGHQVLATGYPQRMAGGGHFLEATRVNGIPLAAAQVPEVDAPPPSRRQPHWAEFHL